MALSNASSNNQRDIPKKPAQAVNGYKQLHRKIVQMNLALLVAVSEYTDPQNNLPACANDFSLVDSILAHSGQFTEVLRLASDTASSHVKPELARFVKTHKEHKVDELFFYFTGHGDLYNDDFYFLLSDFDEDRRQQTALSNAELDSMLRSLSPSLTVKVVDACHSGVLYVKNVNILEKSLDASRHKFEHCYFMFSSQKEQPSFQDAHFSDFTESFGQSILRRKQDTIRYKDIVDYISDDFQDKDHQTPTFVLQADCTDLFCTISQDLRDELKKAFSSLPGTAASKKDDTTMMTPEPEPTITLRDLVIRESKTFCTEAEAMDALNEVKVALEQYELGGDLSDLYECNISVKEDFSGVPKMCAIASWLHQNKNDYFVRVQYREEEYQDTIRVPKTYRGILGSHLSTVAALTGGDYKTQTVTRTRDIPDGITLTATPPYCAVEVRMTPKFENLPWWTEYIVLVFSKATLRFFYGTHSRVQKW